MISRSAVRVLEILFESGFTTSKQIASMGIDDILGIEKLKRNDMIEVARLQKAVKSNKVIEYLCGAADTPPARTQGDTEADEEDEAYETDEAEGY